MPLVNTAANPKATRAEARVRLRLNRRIPKTVKMSAGPMSQTISTEYGTCVVVPASPNGEVERPRRSAGLATRAHNLFPRPRRPTTCASRTVPTLVRGRPHRNYCARAESSAQTGAARGNEPRDAKRSHSRDRRSHRRQRCWWLPHLPARAQAEASGEGSWPRIFKSRSRTMRILGASSNGEVEGPACSG
jgi:hypothetical protein